MVEYIVDLWYSFLEVDGGSPVLLLHVLRDGHLPLLPRHVSEGLGAVAGGARLLSRLQNGRGS